MPDRPTAQPTADPKPSQTVTAADDQEEEDPPDPETEVTRDAYGGFLPPRSVSPVLDQATEITTTDHATTKRLTKPSFYDVNLIGTIARFAALGLSNRAICGKLGIHRDTLLEWRRVHEEFARVWPMIEDLRIYALESRALDPKIRASAAGIVLRRLGQLSPEDWGRNEPEGQSGALSPQHIAAIIEKVARESLATMQDTKRFPVRAARIIETDNDSGARTIEELPISAEGIVVLSPQEKGPGG